MSGSSNDRPVGEGQRRTAHTHAGEESDRAVVPVKDPNKGGEPPAEDLKERAWAKENAGLPRTVCTPRQSCGDTEAARVRSAGLRSACVFAIIRGRSRMR